MPIFTVFKYFFILKYINDFRDMTTLTKWVRLVTTDSCDSFRSIRRSRARGSTGHLLPTNQHHRRAKLYVVLIWLMRPVRQDYRRDGTLSIVNDAYETAPIKFYAPTWALHTLN